MPNGTAAPEDREKLLERAMSRYQYAGDALIEILHTAQDLYGYLSPVLLQHIARRLRLPPSRVLGVATFYHLFSLEPKREHSVVVCLGTACYVVGALRLLETLKHSCAGRTGPDGRVSAHIARCIGACGLAPVAICDGSVMGRVTPQSLCRELERFGAA